MKNNPQLIEAEIKRNFKHNFLVNYLDGSLFWFGASFFAYRTILPVFVANLTDSKWAIALLSTIVATGWLLPQLFTANWVQGLPLKKYAPVTLGFWTSRLPVLLFVPAVWLATISKDLALVVFLLLVTWHIVGSGAIAVGWQDMIAKIFPVDRRGKFFGITNFSGTATGIIGARVVAWYLDHYAFPFSYMWAFGIGAVCIFVSWVFLAMTREPYVEPEEPAISYQEFFRRIPAILRQDTDFRRYILTQITITGNGMAIGFLAVYAVQRWGLQDSQAGYFTIAMLVGQAISNLVFGWLADLRGHKLNLEISLGASVLSLVLAILAPDPAWFYFVFALVGISNAGFILSGIMIVFEFTTPERRPTYIGLNNTVIGLFSAVMPMLGGWLINLYDYTTMFVIAALFGFLGLVLMVVWVKEPRKKAI